MKDSTQLFTTFQSIARLAVTAGMQARSAPDLALEGTGSRKSLVGSRRDVIGEDVGR